MLASSKGDNVEELLAYLYEENFYNQLIRPTESNSSLTILTTDLKILQIDLVCLIVKLKVWFKNYVIFHLGRKRTNIANNSLVRNGKISFYRLINSCGDFILNQL